MNSPERPKIAHGFKAKAGHYKIILGYRLERSGIVTLFALIQYASMEAEVWREFQCGVESAIEQALGLARDAMSFLSDQSPVREVEDLDFDDFIQHLNTNINKEMH